MKIQTALLIAAAVQLSGCASIVNGQNQSISVDTQTDNGPLAGANCTLVNNKGTWYLTTPGSATVNRSFEDMSISCKKDSLEPGILIVKSSTKAMAFGNILFGGVIGAGVDVATGAAYDYPPLITVMMGKTSTLTPPVVPAAPAASAAPVDSASAPQATVTTASK
ncbi:hypothetical protein [Roseateles koreensis]|uniref:Lipoprotein n=1 Tax=Roseateles koreensis TaxID=2987526 RepID=A0ABT5KUG8_9BURK|nr:hypothetical protein [Roseateles koreensis]MDC8786587.1 hypothetical protein [Roseateles koreensis]